LKDFCNSKDNEGGYKNSILYQWMVLTCCKGLYLEVLIYECDYIIREIDPLTYYQ